MELVTIKEVSKFLSVRESTLYSWASKGLIPSHKLNGLLRFDINEIETWVKDSRIEAEPVNAPKTKHLPTRNMDIDGIVKRAIVSVKGSGYNNLQKGKSDLVKSRKGGDNGTL